MQIKSILNSIEKHKGFVYSDVKWDASACDKTLLIQVAHRKRSRGYCSGCGERGRTYDTLKSRRFQFIPLWNILVFLVYAMRRIDCKTCGPTVEMVPWAEGKKHTTKSFEWFLAGWAKRMVWKDVADAFHTSWDTVFRAVEMAVDWGRTRVDLTDITSIGVDEIHSGKDKSGEKAVKFLTLVYQIDPHCKRLLWIGEHRRQATINAFFTWFTADRSSKLQYICSDMWKPYLKVIAKRASGAVHVLDRFHIMSHFSKAI